MKYIVGLGNPGKKYRHTRHNVGVEVLLKVVSEGEFEKQSYMKALTAKTEIAGEEVTLVLPQTFMNLSGESVGKIENIKTIIAEGDDVLIVHDEIDIPFGEIKFSHESGAGGHNGVSSIIEHLGTQKFSRLRIGVAPVIEGEMRKPVGEDAVANFVLKPFTNDEDEKLRKEIFVRAKKGIEVWMKEGWKEAANEFNGSA